MRRNLIINRITTLLLFSIALLLLIPLVFFFDGIQGSYGLGKIVAATSIALGLAGIIIDYILFKTIRNKWTLNLIEVILISMLVYSFWSDHH